MTSEEEKQCLLAAKEYLGKDQFEDAMPLIMSVLRENADNPHAIHLLGWCYMKAGEAHTPLAYQLYRRAVSIAPSRKEIWNNLSRCADEMHLYEEALGYSLKTIEIDPKYVTGYSNAACSLVNMARYEEALKYAEAGLELAPEDRNCLCNKGFALLGLHRWEEAWKFYEHTLGFRFRMEWTYGDEPRWDGSPGKTVIIYGEQGIGDELMYAQCIPEAQADCKKVIIDCDERLQGLFRRSFPGCDVHGTRRRDKLEWLDGKKWDARCAIGSLAMFYRTSEASFTKKPFLVADPERRIMWRALFDGYKKPVIGISWSGGRELTGSRARKLELSDFLPLMRKLDAEWVSLEYKDRADEIDEFKKKYGITIHNFQWINKSEDYDDTAAMIAELDYVVGIHTTALHCAGGLGKKVLCFAPAKPQWRYAQDSFPWYGDFTIHRQRKDEAWIETLSRVDLAYFGKLFSRAKKAA